MKHLGLYFQKKYWHVIAQYILFFLAEAGVVFAGVLVLMIFKLIGITTFIGVILLLAAICFAIYLTIKWYFVVIDLINTDGKIMESFSRSFHLVDNYWWRTLGIIFLISIIVNFAVSIVTTPLSFALSWSYFSHIFSMMAQGSDGKMDPAQSLEFLKAFSHSIGIIVILNLLLQSLVLPMFHIVMYFDLKIRHNDFVNPTEAGENAAAI